MSATRTGASARGGGAREATRARRRSMLVVIKQFRAVLQAMHRHYRYVERKCGVSGAHVWALAEIAENPGIRVTELANALAIHQSTASNLVDKLDHGGYLLRQRHRDDWRVVRLSVTSSGRKLLQRAPRPLPGPLQDALLNMPTARVAALEKSLRALLRQMHADSDASMPLFAELFK